MTVPRSRRFYPSYIDLSSFDGGLNLRDAPSEIAPNETPSCVNVTLDERGGVASRLGVSKLNGSSLLPAAPSCLYYSAVADALLAYVSSSGGNGKLYKSTDGGATWSAVYSSFTAGASAGIVDFAGSVVVVNTIDGVYVFPSGLGAPTHTAGGTNNMEAVKGSCVATWQNKVWVGNGARLWRSAIGDATTWNVGAAGDWVDIRDVDDESLTAIGAGQGLDITGRPSLLVYKAHSVYRVNDPATGAYSVLHSKGAGAAGPQSVAASLGRICSINDRGVWVTDGVAIPVRVSDKLSPLFTTSGLNFSTRSNWTASTLGDRVIFNVARNGSSTNNLQLEYHPGVGWFVAHTGMNLGPTTVYTKNTRKTIGAAAGSGAVYEVGKGGTDDGASITSSWQSRWLPPVGGYKSRITRLVLWGRGAFDAYVRTDFSQGAGNRYACDFTADNTGFAWGTDAWGTGVWGDARYEAPLAFPVNEVGRHVSLVISKTTTTTGTGLPLLGDGVIPETGAYAFYAAHLEYNPLLGD